MKKVNLQLEELYQYEPVFIDTSWCWLEIYDENGTPRIIPQFYLEGKQQKNRNITQIDTKKLIGFQILHESGKVVSFDTEIDDTTKIIYFYRNIQNFDVISGSKSSVSLRYPIQGFTKIKDGKTLSWQVKLYPDGDVYLTDDYH